MSNLMNVMKPNSIRAISTIDTMSSCIELIQAFEAWTVRGHAAISTEGMCQGIQR